jgi:hypothetical protein
MSATLADADVYDVVSFIVFRVSFPEPQELKMEIPLSEITSFSFRPLKWLRYLGWAILGIDGVLSLTEGGETIGSRKMGERTLGDDRVFFYVTNESA